MGKRNKKQKEHEQDEVSTGNQKTTVFKTQSKNNVSNKIYSKLNCIKKSKKLIFDGSKSNQIESNINSVAMNKKSKSMEVNVSTNDPDKTSSTLMPSDITHVEGNYESCKKKKKRKKKAVEDEVNDEKLHQEVGFNGDKKKRKKAKHDIIVEVGGRINHSSEKSIVSNSKRNEKKIMQKIITEEINKPEDSHQETSNISSKIIKHINITHNKLQEKNNDNNEKIKKKKKRKVVEEIVDDEEIDKFCDELDEFHNKKYENWIKQIEENLNKNA